MSSSATKWIVPLVAACIVAAGLACTREPDAARTAKVLRFSAIPDQNTTLLKEKYAPIARHLSQALGVEVEYVPATDYRASVEMFKNGDVHLAWFGGLTGVQARHAVPGARAIVQGEEDPQFISYFIAHKDTGLKESAEFPQEIAKFSFTFGADSSTSGRLMPEFHIRKHTGKSPEELFGKKPAFAASHDQTIELVESGQVQIGAVNYAVYDQRVKDKKTDPETCRVIWRTPPYPDYNFTAHPELEDVFGAGFTAKLQAALIGMKDPALLAAFPRKSLIAARNEDFAAIEDVARDLGFIRGAAGTPGS
jgi:phosphonate transport system substrate-binding protein